MGGKKYIVIFFFLCFIFAFFTFSTSDFTIALGQEDNTITIIYCIYNKDSEREIVFYFSESAPAYIEILPDIRENIEDGYELEYWHEEHKEEPFLGGWVYHDIVLVAKTKRKQLEVNFFVNEFISTSIEVEHSSTIPPHLIPSFEEYENYNIESWFLNTDLTEPFLINELVVTQDITIYAKYTSTKYKVTFLDNADNTLVCLDCEYGESLDINDVTTDIEGYELLGWYIDSARQHTFSAPTFIITTDLIFYGKYQLKTYTVTIYGYNNDLAQMEKTHGSILSKEELNPNSQEGYDFLNWLIDNTNILEEITVLNDITVYANYQIKKFSVVFKGFNDEIIFEETVNYGHNANAPNPETFYREGYSFNGFDNSYQEIKADTIISAIYSPIQILEEAQRTNDDALLEKNNKGIINMDIEERIISLLIFSLSLVCYFYTKRKQINQSKMLILK